MYSESWCETWLCYLLARGNECGIRVGIGSPLCHLSQLLVSWIWVIPSFSLSALHYWNLDSLNMLYWLCVLLASTFVRLVEAKQTTKRHSSRRVLRSGFNQGVSRIAGWEALESWVMPRAGRDAGIWEPSPFWRTVRSIWNNSGQTRCMTHRFHSSVRKRSPCMFTVGHLEALSSHHCAYVRWVWMCGRVCLQVCICEHGVYVRTHVWAASGEWAHMDYIHELGTYNKSRGVRTT